MFNSCDTERTMSHGWCYFPSVGTEIKCNNSLIYTHIYTIFRPYGRKLTAKFRYFPSLRTENSGIQRLISVLWISLFSVRTNRWRHIVGQSSSTNQI